MSDRTRKDITEPYSAKITVTFDAAPDKPFKGTVYNQGDGDHAVFDWPAQPNTTRATELAEFKTRTKWVTKDGKCVKSAFSDPDPKFVCMVSHAGYELVESDGEQNVYLSDDGVRCTYKLDEKQREVISSITFKGGDQAARIDFDEVKIGEQDASRFVEPC